MYNYEEISRRIAFNLVKELITDESPAEERIEKVMAVFRKLGLTDVLDTASRIATPITMPKDGPGLTIQILLNNALDTKVLIEHYLVLEDNLGITDDWRNTTFYPSDNPCCICGSKDKIGSEPRFGYCVCEYHSKLSPVRLSEICKVMESFPPVRLSEIHKVMESLKD